MPPRKVKVVSLGTEPAQTETQPPKSTLVVLNDEEFIEQRPDPPASPPPPSPEPEPIKPKKPRAKAAPKEPKPEVKVEEPRAETATELLVENREQRRQLRQVRISMLASQAF